MAQQLEGYWFNGRTGDYQRIDEHRRWISGAENARAIGLEPGLFRLIPQPNTERDRLKVLLVAMEGGLIRVRRHAPGEITFEHTTPFRQALPAVQRFLEEVGIAGPLTQLKMTDLRTKRCVRVRYDAFRKADSETLTALAQAAVPSGFVWCSGADIDRHLDEIAQARNIGKPGS